MPRLMIIAARMKSPPEFLIGKVEGNNHGGVDGEAIDRSSRWLEGKANTRHSAHIDIVPFLPSPAHLFIYLFMYLSSFDSDAFACCFKLKVLLDLLIFFQQQQQQQRVFFMYNKAYLNSNF